MMNGNNNMTKATTITSAMEHTQAAIAMATDIETDTIIEMTIARMAAATGNAMASTQTENRQKADRQIDNHNNCTNGDGKTT